MSQGLIMGMCSAQSVQSIPAQAGDTYVASNYGSYTSAVYRGNAATGSSSIVAAPVVVSLSNGMTIIPFVANTPITVDRNAANAETITPTVANCYAGSITCTLSATFSNTHVNGEALQSGSFGIQEATNAAMAAGSGTVLIDATFQGPSGSALITAATGSVSVVVQDNRSGTPQLYKWNGSAYALVPSGGSSAVLPGTPNVFYTFVAPGDQSGTTLHDTSGSGNDGTLLSPAPAWTGNGLFFGNSSGTLVSLPASLNGDHTFCASVFEPPFTSPTAFVSFGFNQYIMAINTGGGLSPAWSATGAEGANSVGRQIYQQFGLDTAFTLSNQQEAGFHTLCWTLGSPDHMYTDGVEATYSAQGSNGPSLPISGHWVIGNNPTDAHGQLTFYGYAGWSTALTAAQVAQASFTMTQLAASHGAQVKPTNNSVNPSSPTLTAVGDSITVGFGASTSWVSNLAINAAYATPVNLGIDGFTAIGIAGGSRWRDTPNCSVSSNNLYIIFAGTNDVSDGFSVQQTMNNILASVGVLKAAGCQVGVVTMLSRVSEDSNKDLLNPLIRSNSASAGYFVVDAAAITTLGCDGCSSNTSNFSDGIHPTTSQQVVMGGVASNAINAYGLGSASAANPTVYNSNAVTMVSADRFAQIIPTGAATATLPDCLGVTGAIYQITNLSAGANTITFSGVSGETITGNTTLSQNVTAKFQVNLISQAAAGCFWTRVQ